MIRKIKIGEDRSLRSSNFFEKQKRASFINDRIHSVISFLDKHEIPINEINSFADIVEHFKKDFPFPNAPNERNFELMGIDVTGVLEASKFLKEFKQDFHLVNGKVEIKPEWIKANEEETNFYTRTDAEVKAYEYANEFLKLVQSGYEQGFLSRDAFIGLSNENGLVYFAHKDNPEFRAGRIMDAGERHEKYLSTK